MSKRLKPIANYGEFLAAHTSRKRLRRVFRDATVSLFSMMCRMPTGSNWLRFPYYHHVLDDETKGFRRHLRFFQETGDIISLPVAIEMLESGEPINGRYFVITFDDGFKNCATNAVPILLDCGATAAFFLPTFYIGEDPGNEQLAPLSFYKPLQVRFEFLNWDDCRDMASAGMTIGSHSVNHPCLMDLSANEVEYELRTSKEKIESEIDATCDHFCCPTGRPGVDFVIDRDPAIALKCGYRSFLTTRRGSFSRKQTPMMIERDHTIAAWGNEQLRFFFSR